MYGFYWILWTTNQFYSGDVINSAFEINQDNNKFQILIFTDAS